MGNGGSGAKAFLPFVDFSLQSLDIPVALRVKDFDWHFSSPLRFDVRRAVRAGIV
jgi:hypothetical protein